MQAFALSERYLQSRAASNDPASLVHLVLTRPRTLPTHQDQQDGKIAWAYIRNFADRNTGLAPTLPTLNVANLWDIGGTFLSIIAAHRLGHITQTDAVDRLIICLETVGRLPLRKDGLPAGCYCIKTLRATETAKQSMNTYITHIMRLVAGFIVTAHHYPSLAPEISIILNRWNLDLLAGHQSLSTLSQSQQNYATRTAALINLPVKPNRPTIGHAHAPRHALAYEAMEFGWRPEAAKRGCALYLMQKSRFEATGILSSNAHKPEHNLSTKWAFFWPAVLPTPYSQKHRDAVDDLATPYGWQDGMDLHNGQRDKTLSLNTNAAVLEALHMKALGPLFGVG